MVIIGLTGGIGAGKSTVAHLFRSLSIPVYDSDLRARQLMNEDHQLRQSIIDLLGPDAYSNNGTLNRPWVASQVFQQKEKLTALNAIVHPAVGADVQAWSAIVSHAHSPYGIKESALLYEEGLFHQLDFTILVIAPESTRIQRVMQRDKVKEEEVRRRIASQWTDEQKIPLADFIIYNDGGRSLINQVTDLDKTIRALLA